jgi:ABC-2 type transport system permease protein
MKWGVLVMPLKTSWFNRQILMQGFRQVGWVGWIYLFALLLFVPLHLVMIFSNENISYYGVENVLFANSIQFFLIIVIPVLLAVFLFRFLHVKQSVDFMHSLPMSRSNLFHHYMIIGLFLLLLPIVVNAFVILIVQQAMDLNAHFSTVDIVYWAVKTLIFSLFIFVFSVFIGMFTGMSTVQTALVYIFLLFPAGIVVLFFYNFKTFLYGFPYDLYFSQKIEKLSPITRILGFGHNPLTVTEWLTYLLLTILFYVVALFVYKKRKTEAATQPIVVQQLNPLFKYGVTFCTMMLGGVYFGETQASFHWTIFGFVVGSIVGYLVAEMVLQKSWRVFGKWKGYVVYAGVVFLLFIGLHFDITGFENKAPDVANVERVFFDESSYYYLNENFERGYFQEPQNIDKVYAFHKQLIEDKKQWQYNTRNRQNVVFIYELKNGDRLARQYSIPEKAVYTPFYKTIYETREYKEAYNELLSKEQITADKITISPNAPINRNKAIVDEREIEELIAVLKEEIYDESYEDMIDTRVPWARIELLLENDQRIHLEWKKSYQKVGEWLAQKNYLAESRAFPEDVEKIVVIENGNEDGDQPIGPYLKETRDLEDESGALIIKDRQKIDEALNQSSRYDAGPYIVGIYYREQPSPEILTFSGEDVPQFVRDHFQK